MGFLQGFGRLLAGKLVYEAESRDEAAKPVSTQPAKRSHFMDDSGKKIIPEIVFKNFKSHSNGSRLTTQAWATNTSPFEIEIDSIRLLNVHSDTRLRLGPGEGYDIKIYEGPVISNDSNKKAHVQFKIHENDDLFLAEYLIEYNRQRDGTFLFEEFHRTYAPRDI